MRSHHACDNKSTIKPLNLNIKRFIFIFIAYVLYTRNVIIYFLFNHLQIKIKCTGTIMMFTYFMNNVLEMSFES